MSWKPNTLKIVFKGDVTDGYAAEKIREACENSNLEIESIEVI